MVAHYRIKYILHKLDMREYVCHACYWRGWFDGYAQMPGAEEPFKHVCEQGLRRQLCESGYKLLDVLDTGSYQGIYREQCIHCGRISISRVRDLGYDCTCQGRGKWPVLCLMDGPIKS